MLLPLNGGGGEKERVRESGADPENIEPRGTNSVKYQTEHGPPIYLIVLHLRACRVARAGFTPLNPRLGVGAAAGMEIRTCEFP